ncbi:MAG TPA: BamA/TamA family outer membrane protein, partial [bacterium]|nr:BamA/TamA family outer membrane protein [bacterium]
ADGGRVAELVPDLDAIERPDWSPATARFVFTGMHRGRVDLWLVDADGTGLVRLTDDLHDDRGPRWSPRGDRVLFTSDRADSTGRDLFAVDAVTGTVAPLVVAPGDQWDACWLGDGSSIAYVSDEWGTRDLVLHDLRTGERRRVTRLLGGADSPSAARRGGQLAFTAYEKGRFSIVLVDDPDTLSAVAADPVAAGPAFWPPVAELASDTTAADTARAAAAMPQDGTPGSPPTDPEVGDYRPRLRPEWLAGSFGYGGLGASLSLQTAFSDVLGDHRVTGSASAYRSLRDSDAYLGYAYRKRRVDWSMSTFHFRDYLWNDRTTLGQPVGEEGDDARFTERKWGGALGASYPFHTFARADFELVGMSVERTRHDEIDGRRQETSRTRSTVLLPSLSHTFDNALWGWTGPVQGRRSVAVLQYAVPVGGEPLEFGSDMADLRRYHRFAGDYVFAWRAMATTSWGADPQQFQLGGSTTLRGQERLSIRGRNAALASLEYRYPFLEFVKFGWPLRTAFGGVRGNLFLDVGTAFDDPSRARLTGPNEDGRRALRDLHVGFGVGARARVAYLPLRFDIGWRTDGTGVSSPVYHFFIGPEY